MNSRNIFRCTATLVLEGEPSSVQLETITPYRSMWVEYLRDSAASLSGREGRKVWDSEFAELSLDCANDGSGLIETIVHMQWPPTYDPERRATLLLNPEDIRRLRDDLPEFLHLPSETRLFLGAVGLGCASVQECRLS